MPLPKILRTEEDVDEMARYTKEMLRKAHAAGQEGISIGTGSSMRPEGWENPHSNLGPGFNLAYIAFEAGADAMLEALEKGVRQLCSSIRKEKGIR